MSLSRMNATTSRWRCTPPFLALVTTFSTTGRSALALASVVTSASAAMSEATRLPIIAFWWAASPPKRRPFFGAPGTPIGSAFLGAQREAALVELLDDLVERLLAEVGDGQQVVDGLLDQFAHGVDLRPLEAVAGTLGEVEILDGQVEVGRAADHRRHVAQLQPLRVVAHVGHQADQRAQGVARRGERLTGRDGAVGLDVEDEPVVVGRLLDPRGLDRERHPPHRREDRVDGDDPD